MYILRGKCKDKNKYYYKLFIFEELNGSKSQHWCFISENIALALKNNGVKVYENESKEVK